MNIALQELSEALQDAANPARDPLTCLEQVQLAQDMIVNAIRLLEQVAKKTNDGHANAYVVDHLKIMATSDHGFLSRDYNLDKWKKKLEEDPPEEEGQEE